MFHGIGAAATYYLGRPLHELSDAELAFISAIPNNPTIYDPIDNFDATKKRQELLIDVLVKNGKIPKESGEAIKAEPIVLKTKTKKQLYPTVMMFLYNKFVTNSYWMGTISRI